MFAFYNEYAIAYDCISVALCSVELISTPFSTYMYFPDSGKRWCSSKDMVKKICVVNRMSQSH